MVRMVVCSSLVALTLSCVPTASPDCARDADCDSGTCTEGRCSPAPTLAVTPSEVVISAGGNGITLTAAVSQPDAVVRWELQGAGQLSATSGRSVVYTPPPVDLVSTVIAARVIASLESTMVRSIVNVTINPMTVASLVVTPAAVFVTAGDSPVQLIATVANSSASVSWSLSGPGSLTTTTGLFTAYVPPSASALPNEAMATVTATLGAGLASAMSVFTLRPVPGSLDVQLTAPAGTGATVTISGPNGFAERLTSSRRLDGLVAGTYTLTPEPLRLGAPVEELWLAPPAVAEVSNGRVVTVAASWSKRAGTGALWTASLFGTKVSAFSNAQLSSSQPGASAVGLGGLSAPTSIAMDADGSLWVANYNGGPLVKFGLGSLGASGTPAPDVTLQVPNAGLVRNIAFDADGTLWIVSENSSQLLGIPRAQQRTSGMTTPIELSADSSWRFFGAALDAAGKLWVSETTGDRLVAFSQSALRAGGIQTPSVVLAGAPTHVDFPLGLSFDASGALWVSNYGATVVLKFAPSSLTNSGAPAPAVELNLGPGIHAFDAVPDKDGDLFVVDGASLRRFASSSVVSSGSPTPLWTQQVDSQTFDLALNMPDRRSPIVQ